MGLLAEQRRGRGKVGEWPRGFSTWASRSAAEEKARECLLKGEMKEVGRDEIYEDKRCGGMEWIDVLEVVCPSPLTLQSIIKHPTVGPARTQMQLCLSPCHLSPQPHLPLTRSDLIHLHTQIVPLGRNPHTLMTFMPSSSVMEPKQ